MAFVVKSFQYKANPFAINLTDLSASLLVYKVGQGDYIIQCGSAHYFFYQEALCYVSNLMKKKAREEKKVHKVSSRFCSVIWLLRSFVYRKFSIVSYQDLIEFTFLLKEMEMDYEILETWEFFKLDDKSDKFRERVYAESEPTIEDVTISDRRMFNQVGTKQ